MSIKTKITIYTSETCSYCEQMKKQLKENNIKFKEKPIKDYDNEWKDIVTLTGVAITPTVNYKDEYFIAGRDYQNPNQLLNILNNFEKCTYSESKRVLERIKTLNYHISAAFARLDNLLREKENKLNKDESKD